VIAHTPKDGSDFRGTTLIGRRLSSRRTLFCPMSLRRAASLLSTNTRKRAQISSYTPVSRNHRSSRSSGVNSGFYRCRRACSRRPSLSWQRCGEAQPLRQRNRQKDNTTQSD